MDETGAREGYRGDGGTRHSPQVDGILHPRDDDTRRWIYRMETDPGSGVGCETKSFE
jgi:hypothetical protein